MMKDKPDMQKSTAYRQETNNYSELSPLWLKKKKKERISDFYSRTWQINQEKVNF